MFSSLLRPRNRKKRSESRTPSPVAVRRPLLSNNGRVVEDHAEEEDVYDGDMTYDDDDDDDEGDEDEDDIDTPLLPIFASEHLDKLPLYNITHSCRILIVQKVETTLSWDQLRAPQISQFVVKPIQSSILADHFNRATICALIANCLQFQKEAQTNPGMAGVSKTRAMVSELLAMRLLKEFSIRELIDALSYDFDPLEGVAITGVTGVKARQHGRGARISAVEIAIRSQAKRFLAHPLVVQQLEAIWAGTIVFHSAADNLHRKPKAEKLKIRGRGGYGSIAQSSGTTVARPPTDVNLTSNSRYRRSVTLYDPRDASLFKLSRLRVPRYRQIFSTLSFAIMLGLFLAVLADRSLTITPLEILFWFWSAGYMLDEVVGFSEQGFGLYIMSVWNAFDLGILLLFFMYYFLRLYGLLMDDSRKHTVANMAYDVLASSAIMLFPRLFSVLDHYKYFSQLLIAFRMMAQDMVAILVLIVICCSGFFVAFTLSFSDDRTDGPKVAYALFQLVMGFTPAAWEMWPTYNILGRSILIIFLFICHFLIVTILITVLTNSFMAIVQNANEEHQFLFAVNTISMVKSDALFSYIPPTNIFGWVATPFRWLMPFRVFVRINRDIIKVTHSPILFTIFTYERLFLARNAYEPTDLVERKPRPQTRLQAFSINKGAGPFSPGTRLREPSIVSFHKERALDEVFKRPYQEGTLRTPVGNQGEDHDRRRSTNVVGSWMRGVSIEGGASPPMEQPRSVVERLENRARPGYRRAQTANRLGTFKRQYSTGTRSVTSEPEDNAGYNRTTPLRIEEETELELSRDDQPQETDADGDDELLTNDDVEGDNGTVTGDIPGVRADIEDDADEDEEEEEEEQDDENKENTPVTAALLDKDYFGSLPTPKAKPYGAVSHAAKARMMDAEPRRAAHDRQVSSQTILYSPVLGAQDRITSSSASSLHDVPRRQPQPRSQPVTARPSGTTTPVHPAFAPNATAPPSTRKTITKPAGPKPRPALLGRHVNESMPNIRFNLDQTSRMLSNDRRPRPRTPSFNTYALDLASDLGDNRYGPDPGSPSYQPGVPASFSEQLLRERDMLRDLEHRRRETERARRKSEEDRHREREEEKEEKNMVGRIMLARMNTLEEGFREVLREVKDLALQGNSSRGGSEAGLPFRSSRPGSGAGVGSSNRINTVNANGAVAAAGRAKSPKKTSSGTSAGKKGKEKPTNNRLTGGTNTSAGASELDEGVSPGTVGTSGTAGTSNTATMTFAGTGTSGTASMTIADLGIPVDNGKEKKTVQE